LRIDRAGRIDGKSRQDSEAIVDDFSGEQAAIAYARRLGERLRSIRRQKRLSLQEVEANTDNEFKASVLGAYERGERAISVQRLERLAHFYEVPVDQLLPRADSQEPREPGDSGNKLAIDLVKLAQMSGQPFEMMARFMRMIQVQRQDFNGRVLTIRAHDTRALAAMLDVPVDQVAVQLDALDLLYRPD
jgi:transcriptional regulator with XRE-family HTH domain